MSLSTKQKHTLRVLGQKRPDDAQLGAAGITEPFVAHLGRLLAEKELIKLRLNDTDLAGEERAAAAREAAAAAGAECVAVVGRTALLYRANPELEAKRRVLEKG